MRSKNKVALAVELSICSKNKGADQLSGHRAADLRLCFHTCAKGSFLTKSLMLSRKQIQMALIRQADLPLLCRYRLTAGFLMTRRNKA